MYFPCDQLYLQDNSLDQCTNQNSYRIGDSIQQDNSMHKKLLRLGPGDTVHTFAEGELTHALVYTRELCNQEMEICRSYHQTVKPICSLSGSLKPELKTLLKQWLSLMPTHRNPGPGCNLLALETTWPDE